VKFIKKILFSIVLFVLALAALLLVFRNVIAKAAFTYAMSAAGLNARVSKIDIGVLKPYLRVSGLTLSNPSVAKDEAMINLPEFYVEYSLPDILNSRLFFPRVRIELKELVLRSDKNGMTNTKPLESFIPKKGEGAPPQWRIDTLVLKVGRIVYSGYSTSGAPLTYDINLNLDQTYHNVDNPARIGSDIFLSYMGAQGKEVFQEVQGTAVDTGKKAANAVRDTVSGTAEGVKDAVGGAAKGLKDLIGK
jgi:hypothetical protein